jgi:LmbE family N-acetylglucosaminyl deacetylase
MGPGGTLAHYAALGHRVAVLTATDGGAGRLFAERPTDSTELRRLRRQETKAACDILGIEHLGFLGWEDGKLAERNILEVEEALAAVIRGQRPDVVLTFHGSGISYHPDHRVMTIATVAAVQGAAVANWYRSPELRALPPHRVARLFGYTVLRSAIDDAAWPRDVHLSGDADIDVCIDTRKEADLRWEAILAHATQQEGPPFRALYDAGVFDAEAFVRILPARRSDEPVETDLLAGLD